MDNYDLVNFNEPGEGSGQNSEEEPLKIDLGEPSGSTNGVSRQPLTLGGGGTPAARPTASKPPASVKPAAPAKPAAAPAKPAPPKISYSGPSPGDKANAGPQAQSQGTKISGVKTFFTKLHHGSVVFMDEQIANWLKSNPEVTVKETNVVVGEVQAKKTEPNLIVMIWY